MPTRVMVIGRQAGVPPDGLPERETGVAYFMADAMADVRSQLAACDVVFHYGHPRDALSANWQLAARLRWVHVGGVGVDWALFPALVESEVVLTNSRGVFDTSLPEYLLSLMLALVKDIPATVRAQDRHEWHHRLLEPLTGGHAVIMGAGSIAQGAARLLRAVGLTATLVARHERETADGGGRIRAVTDLPELLPDADWLIVLAPLTPATRGLIGAVELARLPRGARVVNIGRGPTLVQSALVTALDSGALAGAALDVFEQEPLPPESPLWDMSNVIVSPHIGGDEAGTPRAFSEVFLANLRRYLAGEPLRNVVDKRLGFVSSD